MSLTLPCFYLSSPHGKSPVWSEGFVCHWFEIHTASGDKAVRIVVADGLTGEIRTYAQSEVRIATVVREEHR